MHIAHKTRHIHKRFTCSALIYYLPKLFHLPAVVKERETARR